MNSFKSRFFIELTLFLLTILLSLVFFYSFYSVLSSAIEYHKINLDNLNYENGLDNLNKYCSSSIICSCFFIISSLLYFVLSIVNNFLIFGKVDKLQNKFINEYNKKNFVNRYSIIIVSNILCWLFYWLILPLFILIFVFIFQKINEYSMCKFLDYLEQKQNKSIKNNFANLFIIDLILIILFIIPGINMFAYIIEYIIYFILRYKICKKLDMKINKIQLSKTDFNKHPNFYY